MTGPWKNRTDDELADNAQSGLQGQRAVVEAMHRLRRSNEKLTRWLIGLTWVIVALTVVLVVEAVGGAAPTASLPSPGGVQSPSGGSVIPVLSLVVAILAVFFGPLVARANVERQIQVAAREVWMREFREQVAQFFTSVMRRAGTEGGTAAEAVEIRSATLSFHITKLLIAEKAPQYDEFERLINRLLAATGHAGERAPAELVDKFGNTAAGILRRERDLIEATQRMIPASRFVAWLRGLGCPPPRFPT